MASLQKIGTDPKVVKAWHEDGSYWAELRPGWVCIFSGAHTCREDSIEVLADSVKSADACYCDECQSDKK
jgi:hypothetical protein